MRPGRSRREFLRICAAGVPIGGLARAAAGGTRSAPGHSETTRVASAASKGLSFLGATVQQGKVRLSAYKSTAAFEDPKAKERFRAIRVYRLELPGFAFGRDYAEYFDGLSYHQAKLIFLGPIAPSNNRRFSYVDATGTTGSTYAYWMAPAAGEPTGPVPVKIRDPEVWWSYHRLQQVLEALGERHPDVVKVETIGRTVRGRTIRAIRAGNAARCIGLVGAIHAGESGPELILPAVEHVLTERRELLDTTSIAAIPSVNIDERQRLAEGVPWYLRTNANGTDLNRNFPADWDTVDYTYGLDTSDPESATYRGPHPASEPETQAVMDFLRARPIDVVYAFHCLAGICGAKALGPRSGATDAAYRRRCEPLATEYCLGVEPAVPKDKALGFGASAGSLPAWCHRELGVPGFDLEMSSLEKEALAACRADRTDRALLEDYRRRHARGLAAVLQMMHSSSP
jgi:hypothetical protein